DLASDSVPPREAIALEILHSSGAKQLTSQSEVSRVADAVQSLRRVDCSRTNSMVIAIENSLAVDNWNLASDSVPSREAIALEILHSSRANAVSIAVYLSFA
ncbi:hypothetical protein PMAYCL1PPCAC_05716, partial [Pristionchus mayeri]